MFRESAYNEIPGPRAETKPQPAPAPKPIARPEPIGKPHSNLLYNTPQENAKLFQNGLVTYQELKRVLSPSKGEEVMRIAATTQPEESPNAPVSHEIAHPMLPRIRKVLENYASYAQTESGEPVLTDLIEQLKEDAQFKEFYRPYEKMIEADYNSTEFYERKALTAFLEFNPKITLHE